ncbi:MAG: acyl-CoA thioesterase, partial [Spirochaetaceae bacterium]|nr:acyl-CoA thioesterase [Spirochaetaceae bacterium]
CALLDKIGYGYTEMKESGYAFPVTSISVKYLKPFKFRDRVLAKASLEEYENGLRIRYELVNEATGEIHAKGASDQMPVNLATGESCFVCPPVFTEKVEALEQEKR